MPNSDDQPQGSSEQHGISVDTLVAAMTRLGWPQAIPTASPPQPRLPVSDRPDLSEPFPTYRGAGDDLTPSDYIEAIKKYQLITQCSTETLLNRKLPSALIGEASHWYNFHGGFQSLEAFENAFKREFEAANYTARLEWELKQRTQGPDEPLSSFVYVIADFYRRLKPSATEIEKVQTVLQQCHPEYRPYLRGKTYDSLAQIAFDSKSIQEDLLACQMYRPPPCASQALEPKLAWKPASSGYQHYRRKETGMHVQASERTDSYDDTSSKLSLAALDRFSYFRIEKKYREEQENKSRTKPDPRNVDTGKNRGRYLPNQINRFEGNCWLCKNYGHKQNLCPQSKNGPRGGRQ